MQDAAAVLLHPAVRIATMEYTVVGTADVPVTDLSEIEGLARVQED